MKKSPSRKKPFPPKTSDPKSQELLGFFKTGGREGAKKDFFKLLKKSAPKAKP